MRNVGALAVVCLFPLTAAPPKSQDSSRQAIETIARLIEEVRAASYPELRKSAFHYQRLDSDFAFLETRFTASSYFSTGPLEYLVMVNPKLVGWNAPVEGLRAILAHELAHAEYYQTRSRLELFGLLRMLSSSWNAQFERGADRMAIERGYASGLKAYREWLYPRVPADRLWEKKRDYFTPDEIDALERERAKP